MQLIKSEELIHALDSVTWYNGLDEIIAHWKDENYFDDNLGNLHWKWDKFRSYDIETRAQLQVIWIICVKLFGDYGTSPRSGWIKEEHKEKFYQFVDEITETYREDALRR